jgi:hypothetical protein
MTWSIAYHSFKNQKKPIEGLFLIFFKENYRRFAAFFAVFRFAVFFAAFLAGRFAAFFFAGMKCVVRLSE